MRPAFLLALLLAGSAVSLAAVPTAAACHVEGYPRVDPVWETYRSPTNCSTTTPIQCEVTPIFEFGAPTTANGYRQGVYAYSCDLTGGSHTQTTVATEQDLGPPVCQNVPYVAVLGEQVPGTDQDYCTVQYVQQSHTQPVDTPDAVPSTGIFIVYSTDGTTGEYVVVDPLMPIVTCTSPGGAAYQVSAEGTTVRPLGCQP